MSDLAAALRFWADGLGLNVAQQESREHAAFACLDFPDGGSALRLVGPVEPWEPGAQPEGGTRPGLSFDVLTGDFDGVLVRLLECGGRKVGEIEEYEDLRLVTLADPDGNTFDLVEMPDEFAE